METVFHGIPITTAPGRVFTPRPATEALVDAALDRIDAGARTVADVGTGSGAVAVALALRSPEIEAWATDVDPHAVELARANIDRYGLGERVHVLQGDLLDPVPQPVDLVVANLPYLPARTKNDPVHALYRDEPEVAIYAPGDGLGPYRGLLGACETGKLNQGGTVLIQFHRRVLESDCWSLPSLRARLDAAAEAA